MDGVGDGTREIVGSGDGDIITSCSFTSSIRSGLAGRVRKVPVIVKIKLITSKYQI